MFKIHLNEDRQMVLPERVCAWLGVAPGDDLMIDISEAGAIKLVPNDDGPGLLARYPVPEQRKPKHAIEIGG